MRLIRRDNEGLDALHPHPKRHQQFRICLAGTAGSDNQHVRILIFFCVEDVHVDQRLIATIDAHYDTVVIANFSGSHHISACGPTGHYIAPGCIEQVFFIRKDRAYHLESILQAPLNLANLNIPGVEIIVDLPQPDSQSFKRVSRHADEDTHLIEVFSSGQSLLDVLCAHNGVVQLLVVHVNVAAVTGFNPVEFHFQSNPFLGCRPILFPQDNIHIDSVARFY